MAPLEPVPTLPSDADAEAWVLGAIVVEHTRLEVVWQSIQPDDFISDLHRKPYRAILTLDERGSCIDLIALAGDMNSASMGSSKVDEALIGKLTEGVPKAATIKVDSSIVAEHAVVCRIDRLSHQGPVETIR